MPRAKITKRTMAALRPKAAAYVVYDTTRAGFGVRVRPSGAISYLIEYRPYPGGRGVRKRRFKFAEATDCAPDEARRRAGELLQEARRKGGDPLERRDADRRQLTVADLVDRFTADVIARRKAATAESYTGLLRRIVLPEFGRRKVDGLTRPDLARLHGSLRKTPYAANRMLAVVGAMYSFAATHHIVPDGFNPARRIPKFKEAARERFLTADDLDRLGAALREAETSGVPWNVDATKATAKHAPRAEKRKVKLSPHTVGAIRLLLFTGCRLREILGLRWQDADLDRGFLFLPDSKTGRKTVVLNAPAMAVLASLPRLGRYVIAGENAGSKDEKPRADINRPWATICRRAGLVGVRIHDLRHTHASIGAAGGLGLPVIGKLLGHKLAATTARYAHLDVDPQRRASEFIGARLREAMGDVPKDSQPAAVIPLRPTGG